MNYHILIMKIKVDGYGNINWNNNDDDDEDDNRNFLLIDHKKYFAFSHKNHLS